MRFTAVRRPAHAVFLALLLVPLVVVAQDPTASFALLRPGDVVRIRVWREPDLTGEFTIDKAGLVTLPRLGPRPATTASPDSLRAGIIRDFKRTITSPSIEVMFVRRIGVGGGVLKPGVYPVDEVMTVTDAITLAGGAERQDVTSVELIRAGRPTGRQLDIGALLSAVPVQSGDELRVPRQQWIKQNYQMVYVGISSLLAIVTIFSISRR